ncbi:MAG: DUF3293 domain-containing protein [Wenzhouxiangella sp.]
MDDLLWAAYRATDYRVLATPPLVLAVGRPSPGLACLFQTHRVSQAVFITAWNPRSQATDGKANQAAQEALKQRLLTKTDCLYPAEGVAQQGEWQPEPSFLALGIDRPTAIALAREFGQNAIVWAGSDACPRLIACA